MPPAIAMLIAAGITAAASGISAGASSAKQRKYQKQVEEANKQQQEEQELEQRREAIAKALQKKNLDPYGFLGKPITQRTIAQPNMTGPAMIGAIGQGAGSMLNAYASNQQAKSLEAPSYSTPRRFDYNQYYGSV